MDELPLLGYVVDLTPACPFRSPRQGLHLQASTQAPLAPSASEKAASYSSAKLLCRCTQPFPDPFTRTLDRSGLLLESSVQDCVRDAFL